MQVQQLAAMQAAHSDKSLRACLAELRLHQTHSEAAAPPICSSTVELSSPFGAEEICLAEITTPAPRNKSLNRLPSFYPQFFFNFCTPVCCSCTCMRLVVLCLHACCFVVHCTCVRVLCLCACMRLCVLLCCACVRVMCLPCCACVCVVLACMRVCVCMCACCAVRVALLPRPARPLLRPPDAPLPRPGRPRLSPGWQRPWPGRRPPLCPGRWPHQSYVKTGRGSPPHQRHLPHFAHRPRQPPRH
jgi:hypothetical protein